MVFSQFLSLWVSAGAGDGGGLIWTAQVNRALMIFVRFLNWPISKFGLIT